MKHHNKHCGATGVTMALCEHPRVLLILNIVKTLASLSNFIFYIIDYSSAKRIWNYCIFVCGYICLYKIYQIARNRTVVLDSIILKTVIFKAKMFVSRSKLEFLKV